jgi:UDP-2,4-diacetamido-2,4,6-trideoxy-beta-L-altropyranose hydrolase
MNIAFRVDASAQIATGHIMRCLTLAEALRERNVSIRFLSRHMPQYFRDLLAERGYGFADLGSAREGPQDELPHAAWLGTTQAADAAASVRALSDRHWDWIIVDNYALDFRWESALRPAVRHIASLDDIANRRHDCDVLLDPNFYADMNDRYSGKVPPHCEMLLGPRFALLRQEFHRLREGVKVRSGPVKRVLIFFGGVDADNYTGAAIAALAYSDLSGIRVDVVIGSTHPAPDRIEAQCRGLGFDLHVQTDRMAELMAEADMAVGAGGGATWERCCLGLPSLAISIAGNQGRQVADAANEGLVYAPDASGELPPFLARQIRALMENSALRHMISRNGMRAVDGRGVSRVVSSLGLSDIRLRRAAVGDSRNIFEWRNNPDVRAASRSGDIIGWESHQNWFAAVLASPDRLLLVGERPRSTVGVVRFDLIDTEAEISIYLVPGAHPWGEGRELLQAAERWLRDNRPTVAQIRANILGANLRSQRLFLGANYRVDSTTYLKRLY